MSIDTRVRMVTSGRVWMVRLEVRVTIIGAHVFVSACQILVAVEARINRYGVVMGVNGVNMKGRRFGTLSTLLLNKRLINHWTTPMHSAQHQ